MICDVYIPYLYLCACVSQTQAHVSGRDGMERRSGLRLVFVNLFILCEWVGVVCHES